MGFIISTIKTLIMLIIIAITLYVVGYLFDWLPENYAPHKLFPQEYTDMKKALHKDAMSKSSTAKVSNVVYEFVDQKEEIYDDQRKAEADEKKKAAEFAAKAEQNKELLGGEGNPIDKAKEKVEQINQQTSEQQKMLNQL